MKTAIKLLFATVSIALITACGGGSSDSAEITGCCQNTVCYSSPRECTYLNPHSSTCTGGSDGKTYYDKQCTYMSPTYQITTLYGHPTPTGLLCTAQDALYGCKKQFWVFGVSATIDPLPRGPQRCIHHLGQDHAITQFALGQIFREGQNVEQHFALAVYWYTLAAKQGQQQQRDMLMHSPTSVKCTTTAKVSFKTTHERICGGTWLL